MPEIRETNGIHGDENWYREGLEVTISSEDETVTEVHYLLKDAKDYETEGSEEIKLPEVGNEESEGWVTAKGREVVIPISSLGRTRITAYVSDGKNKSEPNTSIVKYDNVAPNMTLSNPRRRLAQK